MMRDKRHAVERGLQRRQTENPQRLSVDENPSATHIGINDKRRLGTRENSLPGRGKRQAFVNA